MGGQREASGVQMGARSGKKAASDGAVEQKRNKERKRRREGVKKRGNWKQNGAKKLARRSWERRRRNVKK